MKLFMVCDATEDFISPIGLVTGERYPPGGLLTYEDSVIKTALFRHRKEARDAINRTHHYAMAYGQQNIWPDKSGMKILECVLLEES